MEAENGSKSALRNTDVKCGVFFRSHYSYSTRRTCARRTRTGAVVKSVMGPCAEATVVEHPPHKSSGFCWEAGYHPSSDARTWDILLAPHE